MSRVGYPVPTQISVLQMTDEVRVGESACLAFHPHELKFAIATERHVSIRSIT